MYLKYIYIENFRQITKTELEFSKRGNVFVGGNGEGKTSILEALTYLSLARSYREYQPRNLVKFNTDRFLLEAEYESFRIPAERIRIEMSKKGIKRVYLNGQELKRISELVGRLKTVIYFGGSSGIIKGGPEERRRFLDSLLVQTDKMYLSQLIKYKELLKRRNSVLQDNSEKPEFIRISVSALEEQMLEPAFYIMSRRESLLEELSNLTSPIFFSSVSDKLVFKYRPSGRSSETPISPSLIRKMYKKFRKKDLELRITSFGPHRDSFSVSKTEEDIRVFGSSGEIKLAVMAMKSAEFRYIEKITGETPILIIDDREADFDEENIGKVDSWINSTGGQYFTVSMDDSNSIDDSKLFRLVSGSILVE